MHLAPMGLSASVPALHGIVDAPVLQQRMSVAVKGHELTVGKEFRHVHSCRRALRDAAIALHFEMQTIKSDKTRYTAKCASEGCPWRIHAARLPGVPTFTIRTIHNEHTCAGITHLGHQQASVQWVADVVAESINENPHYKPKEILEEIHRVHGIALSYKQAWRGKERIMATVRGNFEEDYHLLTQYCDMIKRTNTGSIAKVYADPVDNLDIRTRSCYCRGWELSGLPCAHAIAALLSCRQNMRKFTESCFTVANYCKAYSKTIHPVPDKSLWKEMPEQFRNGNNDAEVIIKPPKLLEQPVRPKKRRALTGNVDRAKRMVHCSRSFFLLCSSDHQHHSSPLTLTQIMIATSIGIIIAAALKFHLHKLRDQKIIPKLRSRDKGGRHIDKVERFPHYVARQMGFNDRRECPLLCKLAAEYIRKLEGCEEDIYTFFSSELDVDSLFVKLVEEFERCILSYFAFHWGHADLMIAQVLSSDAEPKRKLKQIFMAATREQRFERVTKNLKVARIFTTLVEEMKAMGLTSTDDSQCTEVMAPVAHSDRSPVLLLMGGGMGAGKSTVLKDILKEPFWAGAAGNAVVIEADAFKESDVIYRALSKRGHSDMVHTAELVHQSSTDAASSLLVTALNEGRDVIMDGTLSWIPFVLQTITMARCVHRRRYRMGAGYKKNPDGTIIENYWEQLEEEQVPEGGKRRKPYRIELVGVVCEAYLAVIRGIRRAIMCRRAVRANSQLKSHKRFANAFPTYCQLVDNARLYSTNALEGPPKLIGWKDKDRTLLVDPDEIGCLKRIGRLNENADSIYELYRYPNPACQTGSIWKDIVLSPSRLNIQLELKYTIQKVEMMSNADLNS
ncbi:uncharacterized protein LOC120163761 [Hibiscus syriacus]|uniref:uncharacterized protein LOC120163761 n=1 Tax=Hibiscus syriacus TaxID=106335 RepID=UPI001924C475|nr:uncharacterized protein LOC120163761 [Hibiscus syriacus]